MVTRSEGLLYDDGQGYSKLDAQAHRDRLDGYAVVSGLGVTHSSGMTLSVAAGSATVGQTSGSVDTVSLGSATTVTLPNGDSTDPRKDVVYIDTAGAIQYTQGTPEPAAPTGNTRENTYQPEPPFPATEGTILAEVWVPAGATTLQSADIRDRRSPADVTAESGVFDAVNVDAQHTESRAAEVIIREDAGTWIADGPTGEIDSGSDPGVVVNSALANSDDVAVVGNQGNMTVSTPIDHTTGGKSLVIGAGTTLQSDGTTDPIRFQGNDLHFKAEYINANGHSYAVVDRGIGPGFIEIGKLENASDSLWFHDTANAAGNSNAEIHIGWLKCNGGVSTTPRAINVPSGGPRCEGYHFEIGVILSPTEYGIFHHGNEDHQYWSYRADIDGTSGGATNLASIDERNVALEIDGYIQTSTAYDVRLGSTAHGSKVSIREEYPDSPVRVQRETPFATVEHAYDPSASGNEFRDQSQGLPDSLDGTVQDTTGSGAITLDASNGYVEQSTGTTDGSFANYRRVAGVRGDVPTNFDHRMDFSITANFQSNTNQEAWLVWGDRAGPGVGFNVVGGDIYGWAHDGTSETQTASLQSITTGTDYSLNCHFNPTASAWFWVGETVSGASSDFIGAANLPDSGDSNNVERVVTFDFNNTAAEDKDIRWTDYDMQIRKR